MVFRNISLTMDELNGLRWFRQEVDHISKRTHTLDLREILGEDYKPRYERLLRFIPFEELEDVEIEPLGHGKFGVVLPATWKRPRSMEHKAEKSIPVVLKHVLPDLKMSNRKKLEKFLYEVQINIFSSNQQLDLCYSALAGSASSWVDFYGVTRLPKEFEDSPSSEPGGVLCLVFQRATKGNLTDFLKQTTLKDDWGFVLEALKSIGGGLSDLHKRGIAHRFNSKTYFQL